MRGIYSGCAIVEEIQALLSKVNINFIFSYIFSKKIMKQGKKVKKTKKEVEGGIFVLLVV